MKMLLLSSAALAALVLVTPEKASATVGAEVCGATGCAPVDPVTAGVFIAVSTAVDIERSCTKDRSRSCTKQAKKAGQNLIDYARFKKNPVKAVKRRVKKIFGW